MGKCPTKPSLKTFDSQAHIMVKFLVEGVVRPKEM